MGDQQSKNPLVAESSQIFSAEEQKTISEIYLRICDGNKEGLSVSNLEKYAEQFTLSPSIAKRLFHFMKSVLSDDPGINGNSQVVNESEFLVSVAFALKGSTEQRTDFIGFLSTGAKRSSAPIPTSQLKQFFEEIWPTFVQTQQTGQSSQSRLSSWNFQEEQKPHINFLKYLFHDLIYKNQKRQHEVTEEFPWDSAHSSDSVESWLTTSSLSLNIVDAVFHKVFPVSPEGDAVHQPPLVPHCEDAPWAKFSSLLDPSALVFLTRNLPTELQARRFLFSTRVHGESFAMMMRSICYRGPSVIIVEDTDGRVFGGFATESWNLVSHFTGGPRSFLFSLSPVMDIYTATGYNDNYQYLNHGQETMPNGLGMGGQLEYFGLWLDSEFGEGQSCAEPQCTTYGSPRLSLNQHFTVKTLEVWGVGPAPKADSDQDQGHGSILDKDPAAKAMLTMMNKGPLSEGLREDDPTASIPEDHTI